MLPVRKDNKGNKISFDAINHLHIAEEIIRYFTQECYISAKYSQTDGGTVIEYRVHKKKIDEIKKELANISNFIGSKQWM